MTPTTYRLHALVVRSDIALDARQVPDRRPDLEITRGDDREVPPGHPEATILAQVSAPDGALFYTLFSMDDRFVLRYHGLCDFVVAGDLASVTWHLAPGANRDLVPIMASGTLMASVLVLRHELVLHASAVEVAGAAIAFVGRSGMGKSTLASMAALAGGALVSDDVLRVEPSDPPLCFVGANETRLRAAAASLASDANGTTRATADDRIALQLPHSTHDAIELRAVVVPYIDKDGRPLLLERVRPARSVLLLSRFPRILGWQDEATGRIQFERLGELVTNVAVWRCRVPWGPPFASTLVDELLTGTAMRPVGEAAK